MHLKHKKTLVTGKPGTGKTTLIQKIVGRMQPVRAAGFYTTEMRSKGARTGFELCSLDGRRRILAHVSIESPQRVGKYGVDTSGFEEFLHHLDLLNPQVELIVIDEIGKMELFSNRFRKLISAMLDSDRQVLATIALHGEAFISEIKKRPDVHLVELTRSNRDHLPEFILHIVS
jgi:nucleoside-triphosphatase